MSTLTANTVDFALTALQDAGFTADYEGGPGPTDLVVQPADCGVNLLLAYGFNREDGGWEAVAEVPGDALQTPLVDGPGANADSQEVVRWVRTLVEGVQAAQRVRTAMEETQRALLKALSAWHDIDNRDGLDSMLLDEDYPFSASLDEVLASVGHYVERLNVRLGE